MCFKYQRLHITVSYPEHTESYTCGTNRTLISLGIIVKFLKGYSVPLPTRKSRHAKDHCTQPKRSLTAKLQPKNEEKIKNKN